MISKDDTTTIRIGELNGKWTLLFRTLMAGALFVLPFLVGLQVWFVTTIYSIQISQEKLRGSVAQLAAVGPRYTRDMALHDNMEMRDRVLKTFKDDYPPAWLRDEVRKISANLTAIQVRVERLEDAIDRERADRGNG